jgi:hypothetical protein
MAEPIRGVQDEIPIFHVRFQLFDGSGLGHEVDPKAEAKAGALPAEPGGIAWARPP